MIFVETASGPEMIVEVSSARFQHVCGKLTVRTVVQNWFKFTLMASGDNTALSDTFCTKSFLKISQHLVAAASAVPQVGHVR